ncbi:unnamed protein product [Bursaphelenchus okinawaensis]|uniref:F-box domain-containing protein n=1 Tax=Bursaphelenchus okinawaensis TaxID=465554 RepID=A0A811JRC9_9BILA|nr:unnamed protein product [Bursaphelenchus okinawaensis]CAG9078959.1 unnamed protein product [Bursaphelenchus okinawaensis]
MDQISKNSPESQRLQYLTHVLNSYKNNQLEVVLQRALVLCALYRMPDFMVKDRFKLDYRVLLVHVVDIMVEYTHRAEHRIHTFLYKIQSSKQFEVLRADMFELHPRYHLALKDGTSTLHGTVKYLFENDITIWHGVTKSLPVFENFTLLPYELQVQVLENIPRSTLVHCRLLSRDMNNVVNFTFQKKRQKASNELVEQISTSTVVEKRFGRDMIPYVECRVKSLRRGKWVLPKDYNSTVTLPMERVVYILKGFRFSNEQLERIHPEQKKMLNL